jgi:hypothetical protein
MAKIVIVAPSDVKSDVDDAVKMLRGAGHDVDVEEPTPKSLLHIVLGLLGPNAYGFGPGYAFSPGSEVDDADGEPADSEQAADDADAGDDIDVSGDDFNFESLGQVTVDGELIEAVRVKQPTSVLRVERLVGEAKMTYNLNESIFSFWPADVKAPSQRLSISVNRHSTSIELPVEQAEKAQLMVGDDIIDMFQVK